MPTLAPGPEPNPYAKVTEQASMAEYERREIRKIEREIRAKRKKKMAEKIQTTKKVEEAARQAMVKVKVAKTRMSKAGNVSNAGKVCNRAFNAGLTLTWTRCPPQSPSPRAHLVRVQKQLSPTTLVLPPTLTSIPIPRLIPHPANRRKPQPHARRFRRCKSVAQASVQFDTRTMPIAHLRWLSLARPCPLQTSVRSSKCHFCLDKRVRET